MSAQWAAIPCRWLTFERLRHAATPPRRHPLSQEAFIDPIATTPVSTAALNHKNTRFLQKLV